MVAAGNGRTSVVDGLMDGMGDYSSEFMFDSEEGSPLPTLDFFDSNSTAADAIPEFDATVEPKALLSPSASFGLSVTGTNSRSTNDSSSDSASSSKQTISTASSKTTFPAVDVIMSDGLGVKPEPWAFSDFVHGDEDESATGQDPSATDNAFADGTVNPSAIEDGFALNGTMSGVHPGSPIDSLSPFTAAGDALSPQDSQGAPKSASAFAMAARGHSKGHSQYSLTQSMHGLTTGGSREVSPFSNMITSQGSSPGALMSSPSPSANFKFHGLPAMEKQDAQSQWPNPFAVHLGSLQQQGVGGDPGLQVALPPASFAFQGVAPYCLTVHPTPSKSRVETQIPIKLTLSPLPPNIKRLHLPTHTISKPKLLAKPTPKPSPDMLELHTALVCTSAMQKPELKEKALKRALTAAQSAEETVVPKEEANSDEDKPMDGAEVHICMGCMTRERKRAARKKVKKPEDEQLWQQDEARRVIVFNTHEVKDWQRSSPLDQPPGHFQVDAPMRIACYCRHHNEKSGFQVIFTITDHIGNFIAQSLSPSIMITDDHKTHTFPQAPGGPTSGVDAGLVPDLSLQSLPPSAADQRQDANALSPPEAPFRASHSSSDLQSLKRNTVAFAPGIASPSQSQPASAIQTPKNLSRPVSPSGHSGPSSKKRKASGPTKVPSTLAMTRLDTSLLPTSQSLNQVTGASPPASMSPFSPDLASFPGAPEQALFGASLHTPAPAAQPFANGPPTPNSNDQTMFTNANRSVSLENIAMQMYSAPASRQPSRPESPNGLRSGVNAAAMQQQNAQFAQALASSLSNYSIPQPPRAHLSVIHKIIPAEGPKSGGIEVTILGSGFFQGLEVMFGDVRATTTTFWGESSLVCLLPPSLVAGGVRVSFKQQHAQPQQFNRQQPIFRYIDDDENQILRTALSIMGHKMTGNFTDAADIARKIIGENGPSWAPHSSSGNQAPFNGFSVDGNFEAQLLKVLDFIDLDDSPHKARYNLRRSTGQTMLHLACSMGLQRFVAGLLARGANPDIRDKGGYTALHMAALNDHPEIVRRLILNGADPTIRTLSGLTASDVARSREVLKAVRRVERHVRSRSGGSLHSRANSASSLKSLWEPPQATAGSQEPESAEESPEYTSEDMVSSEGDDAEVDDEDSWLDMRRSSVHDLHPQDTKPGYLEKLETDVPSGLGSPSAAVTAFKEQVAAHLQQIQQAMTLQFQNLPQFPYLPQIPNMPPLPDYQAAVMQRLASMVPTIGITRPGSAGGGQPSAKDLDGRWWDLSALMASAAPPPAYEEIFPQGDLDKKQASAAQAAAEAEADHKCAVRFDHQPTATVSAAASSSCVVETSQKKPAMLQIGRKNAMTKEQQENLRRAHAEKLKRLSRDRNLFFIWIPLLIIVMTAMLYNRFPGLFMVVLGFLSMVYTKLRTAVAMSATQRAVEI